VGCGAISQSFYLPALAVLRDMFSEITLVDPDEHSLASAVEMVPSQKAHALSDLAISPDLVVVATPNALHFQHAREALARGAHVLLEKPFVLWPEEGRQLIAFAAEQNRLLAVNQTRRLFPVSQALRAKLKAKAFGKLRAISHYEGYKLDWPFASGAAFTANARRTGVIMDLGVHVIDFYHFLLEPKWTLRSAIHDGFEGPEGLAEIELAGDDIPISLRLSRYQRQQNVATLTFENAEVTVQLHDFSSYSVQAGSSLTHVRAPQPVTSYGALAQLLVQNFVAAALGREALVCNAASSLPVIEVLDQIYQRAHRYPEALGAV
jgi:predicted dehydrogenase